ncbi:hypothetical protein RESH_02766 [Rhodopirellula europaea SH398]|uniref:Uncharacterized protein n=1 Tax=Rhodopirellula europaea SH398 TaxID=1263868 RepID=M5SK96_9BACT|nr:hypothetical protein RESH_02766 [Rhodopirellula europaea SH398]
MLGRSLDGDIKYGNYSVSSRTGRVRMQFCRFTRVIAIRSV